MADLAKFDIIECPYMPDGFIAMKDAAGTVVMNTATGVGFRIPPFEFELKMPDSFRLDGDRIVGTMEMLWRLRNA